MYKYPQEHALHASTLESSLKLWACCSPRRNTLTHTRRWGNSSHSYWSNTSHPLLPPSHTCLVFLSSQTSAVFPEMLICWQHDTDRPAESEMHTHSHTYSPDRNTASCLQFFFRKLWLVCYKLDSGAGLDGGGVCCRSWLVSAACLFPTHTVEMMTTSSNWQPRPPAVCMFTAPSVGMETCEWDVSLSMLQEDECTELQDASRCLVCGAALLAVHVLIRPLRGLKYL